MGSITLIGGGIAIALALMGDTTGTVKHITIIITIRGMTFLARKLADSISKDNGQIIDFAGWSMAGLSIVQLIKNAKAGIMPLVDSYNKTSDSIKTVADWFKSFAETVDKFTPWN